MSLSAALLAAALYHEGSVRSFPITSNAARQRNYAYDAPDKSYARLGHPR
jgi:hypothetical protein